MHNKRKLCCKLEILYIKYSPAIMALFLTLDNVFNINKYIPIFSCLCTPSILYLYHIFLCRNILKFCDSYRIIIDYILVNVVFRILQNISNIDSDFLAGMITATSMFCLIIFIYTYVTDHKKLIIENSIRY